MDLSRNQRRKLVYLAYCVCAAEVKHCQIEQSDLRRRYPDTNYDLTITVTTPAQAKHLSQCLKDAFERRGYLIYANRVTGPVLNICGFYKAEGAPS